MTTETIKELEQNIETLVVAFEKETGMEVYAIAVLSRFYSKPGNRIAATLKRITDAEQVAEAAA